MIQSGIDLVPIVGKEGRARCDPLRSYQRPFCYDGCRYRFQQTLRPEIDLEDCAIEPITAQVDLAPRIVNPGMTCVLRTSYDLLP